MTPPTRVGAHASGGRWIRRLGVTVAATTAGVAGYLLQLVLGQQVRSPRLPGQAADVTLALVVLDGAVASLLAWAVLERLASRAHAIWRVVAVLVLLLSLSAPFSATGVTLKDRQWLACMHLAVGIVLIVFLPGSPADRPRRPIT